jgi:hypothetical protein
MRGPGISGAVALLLLLLFWSANREEVRAHRDGATFEGRLRALFANNAPGIRAFAIPMNGLLYLFGERHGAETVFVARSRTRGRVLLFTPEVEFERGDPERDPVFARNLEIVRERLASLHGSGVARVLLVPIPTKLSVELAADPSLRSEAGDIPAKGGATVATPDGRRTAEAYERLVASLGGAEGVSVASLQRLFVARAANGDDPVFSYEDTHWTSLGLALAASEVVRVWRGTEAQLFRAGRLADAPGDLQRMLALPDSPRFRTHPFEENVYEARLETARGSCPAAVFLLGTSYSSSHGQTLAGQVSQASGCSVIDLSVAGKGSVASFGPLFGEHRERLPGATVIWEFPFRDLLDPASFVAR